MTYQTRLYFRGGFAAALAGAANAVTLVIVDPLKFNLLDWPGTRSLLVAIVASSLVGFALYVQKHPLPDPEKDIDAKPAAQHIVEMVAAKSTQTEPNEIPKDVRELAAQIVNGGGQ